MIKRFFALLILGFFITFKCLTWIPSAAVSGIPAIDALEYSILQTIAMATQNGAEINFTDSLADIIHDVNEGIYSVEYGLKELLKEYASKAWDQIIFDLNDPYNQDNLNFLISGISFASGNSVAVLNEIMRQYDNKVLDNSSPIVTRFNTSDTAFWNKYNTNYINDYVAKMNYVEIEIPTPDPNYISYINEINNINESWLSASNPNPTYPNYYLVSPMNALSICSINPSNDLTYRISYTNYNILTILTDIRIYSIGNNYYHFDCQPIKVQVLHENSGNYNVGRFASNYPNGGIFTNDSRYLDPPLFSKSGSLEDVFKYIRANFSNVNIYVDNIPWALPNSVIDNQPMVQVPNAVIDENSDDGKIISNPIYWVVDQDTGNPIDAQINLDKLANILKGMIDGTREDTTIGFDDLVESGVIEKTDGSSITDADVGTRSIADVIDDAASKTGDLSITGEIAGVIPPLPILPSFSAGPQGDPTAGFKGMSVLARIVNVTNRGLPDDIIDMFYGIVACLIVLGLIKVLHK